MRISATTLESFRLYMDPGQEWMTEAALLATIRGDFTPTPEILLGRAFGQVLERPERYTVPGGYAVRIGETTYQFSDATMAEPLALIDRRGVFEAKATKAYGDDTVVAKADHLLGAHLSEFKTSTGSFDIDRYLPSYQWRLMVDLFEPLDVTYHIFRLDDHGNGVAELRGIETFRLYPYAALHADCCDLVRDFAMFVRAKGLDTLLRQRQAEAAA